MNLPFKHRSRKSEKTVVVGNGMVGHHLCRRLRELDTQGVFEIVVYGKEPCPAYDRVNLTDLATHRNKDKLTLAPLDWYKQNGIRLHLGDPVSRINAGKQLVICKSGRAERYDHLVLAIGSKAFVPPVFNHIYREGLFAYRTLSDIEQILAYSERCRSAAVIGGGLLGLEAARALHKLGKEVHVVEIAHYLMPQQLDPRAGELLEEHVKSLGIHTHLNAQSRHVESGNGRHRIYFTDGQSMEVDMIVVSVGIQSVSDLAMTANIARDPKGWILVDDHLQTNVGRIYAIGDCVNHRGKVYGLVAPGYQMGDVLASNLVGKKALFLNGDKSTRLKVMGIEVAALGDSLERGRQVLYESKGIYRKLVIQENHIVGAMAIGPCPEVPLIQDAIQNTHRVNERMIRRFETSGLLWGAQAGTDMQSWPAETQICNCMKVTKGALCQAMENGCKTLEKLIDATGASTVCGSCSGLLNQLIGATKVIRTPLVSKILVLASALTVLAIGMTVAIPAMPFSISVQKLWFNLDTIWRSSLPKQISGYTLLGIVLFGLLLSLRKRISWLKWGAFANWRMIHGISGLLTLIMLFIHTGFHFGANMNCALMTVFALLNLVGAFAGAASGLEHKAASQVGYWSRRLRPALTWGHIVLFWPLPVLIGFHIVSVYYF